MFTLKETLKCTMPGLLLKVKAGHSDSDSQMYLIKYTCLNNLAVSVPEPTLHY